VRARGFTLLEALVSLVIVALVATVAMQSLFQVLGLRERVLRHEAEARHAALQQAWFRDSVAALVAAPPGPVEGFRGDAAGWSGTTLAGPAGSGLRRIEWRLDGPPGARLLHVGEAGGEPWPLRRVGDRARMQYLDADGTWQVEWPPAAAVEAAAAATTTATALPAAFALPRAVRLDDPDAEPALLWWEPVTAGPGLPQPLRAMLEPADADAF